MVKKKDLEEEELEDLEGQREELPPLTPEEVAALRTEYGGITTREEALSKVAILLADPERRKMMSEINKKQVIRLAKLLAVSEGLKAGYPEVSSTLDRFVNEFLELMISNKRLGRKEILKIAASLNYDLQQRGMMSRMNPLTWFGRG
jgi:hypothetical protein